LHLKMEEEELKPFRFRNALDNEVWWDWHPKIVYLSLLSVQYVGLHQILMSIMVYHCKQLTKCIYWVELIAAKVERYVVVVG
jgi:hypothetical protein